MKIIISIRNIACAVLLPISLFAQQNNQNHSYNTISYIQNTPSKNAFSIANNGKNATICVDDADWKGVISAANDLSEDLLRVTDSKAKLNKYTSNIHGAILIGTIGKSKIIDQLIAQQKIDVKEITGKWESYIIQTIGDNLVIAGSDKRGTIYGIYDVSEKIDVSPWYWWADVPATKSKILFVKKGRYVQHSPKVKYRGIFINDEHPSFAGWAKEKFGEVNSKMYVHMFKLLLRLKANYLWPAMWAYAFNEDDPQSPYLADEYGIIMGTSHHEPMMRAHKEYTSRRNEIGPWDYANNKTNLDKFFFDGLERNKNYDNLITIGMRGDGDKPMGKGDGQEYMKVLNDIIKGERKIIGQVYGKDSTKVPQLWAIFTEVQRYYDAGFTVPDDVTLLFCDNNWGYIRRTGPLKERKRSGGMGLYYHIDMNGGPWNYRWINTTTVSKLRQQLHLAYETGLDRIWIVNVGDLKPKEIPIDFIMHYAWNPDGISATDANNYPEKWALQTFGADYAKEIADIVAKYTKYNLMRKPEVQYSTIFSQVNYHEAEIMDSKWTILAQQAENLYNRLPANVKDAYYQLVLYPVKAGAGVAKIYLDAGKNNLYAKQGRVSANQYADNARKLFKLDKQLSDYYNDTMSQGKWKVMMSDIHIGYQNWSMPKEDTLPPLVDVTPLATPTMGIAVEGKEDAWPETKTKAILPTFDFLADCSHYIDIFNKGNGSFAVQLKTNKPWIIVDNSQATISVDKRIRVSIDWNKINVGKNEGIVEVSDGKAVVPISIIANKYKLPNTKDFYFGGSGEFSIPAYAFNQNVKGKNASWQFFPDLGRSLGDMGIENVNVPSANITDAPRLEYQFFVPENKDITVCLGILPTQDVDPERGLRIAVSIDDAEPQILDARRGFVDIFNEYKPENIQRSKNLKPLPPVNKNLALVANGKPRRNEIFDNLRWLDASFKTNKDGMHTLKVYMIDPEIVLENIVINPDNQRPSYQGAPPKKHLPIIQK